MPIVMMARRNGQWLFWVAGLAPIAIGVLILAPGYRQSPRVLDGRGVTRRDGKHLPWGELLEQRTVTVRTAGGTSAGLSHTELHFQRGVVKIFPVMFDDLDGIYRFLAQRQASGGPATSPDAAQGRSRGHHRPTPLQ